MNSLMESAGFILTSPDVLDPCADKLEIAIRRKAKNAAIRGKT